jgi:hypothetical protein
MIEAPLMYLLAPALVLLLLFLFTNVAGNVDAKATPKPLRAECAPDLARRDAAKVVTHSDRGGAKATQRGRKEV